MERRSFLETLGTALVGFSFSVPATHSGNLIKPKRISQGATIGLISPASPLREPDLFDNMLYNLHDLGYKVKTGKHSRDITGYLAGKDEDRAADLMTMFTDPEIDAILCVRGGWGSNRILDLLDFDTIAANPKPLIGFSDITSLLLAIYHKCNMVTFHGPVGKSDWNSYTVNSWKKILEKGDRPLFTVPDDEELYTIIPGTAEGHLIGGNLSVLTSMMGSDYLPSFDGAVLFLEDVGEKVYRVDRMLTQLRLNGILDRISGLVFGKCTRCLPGEDGFTLKELLHDHFDGETYPVFYGAMISHEERNLTLPIGIRTRIKTAGHSLQILEPAVS